MTAEASDGSSRPIAPSSRLALYVAVVAGIYLVRDPILCLAIGGAIVLACLLVIALAPHPVPSSRWKAAVVFIGWVFVMRGALELVNGASPGDAELWLTAGRQAIRVAVLAIGVLTLMAVTTAHDIVDEMEHSRMPRWLRLLVMMLVQYPRVLRDRYEQIVEAQVARGADRPRTIAQRVGHGATLLLPVMQSELNAIGERAGLIHLRGLDVDVAATDHPGRQLRDYVLLAAAAAIVIAGVAIRIGG